MDGYEDSRGRVLNHLFAHHERAVLAFSGGKDSLACLNLCREYRDQLDVCWVNTGASYPHMAEFVRGATEGFNLVELASDQAGWIEKYGYPAEMVPVANSMWRMLEDAEDSNPPEVILQPWTSCCAKIRTGPILEYLESSSITLLLHGQRRLDGGGFSITSGPNARVEIARPIWGWTERAVLEYLAEHEIDLPEQYAHGVIDSLECWNCTARVNDTTAKKAAKLTYIATRYPDLFKKLKLRMAKVYLVTKATFDEVRDDTNHAWINIE